MVALALGVVMLLVAFVAVAALVAVASLARRLDERLNARLATHVDRRLGESFKLVSDRLAEVHRGLGEMQGLAHGVGDLKRLLSNVKARGTWGEVQLGALLEDLLAPEQYGANVPLGRGEERVEYAVRLPVSEDAPEPVWLPIDAKFPQEDYARLVAAEEDGDAAGAEEAAAALEARVCRFAREVKRKYLHPPRTTDFAILFLPTESLFGAVLRRPGLLERLRREHLCVAAGPTTLAALLSALRMGFRTLAIQKRSSEVWKLLGAVRTDVERLAGLVEAAQRKLEQACDTLDDARRKTRQLETRLRAVEAPPALPPHASG